MTKVLHVDFETRSALELSDVGIHNYASHSSTEVLMLAWACGNEEPSIWEPHLGEMPAKLCKRLNDPEWVKAAWNSGFERNIFWYKLGICVPICNWHDPMIGARYLSMPGSLDSVGEILDLDYGFRKDKAGEELLKLFSKPLPTKKPRKKATNENTLFDISPVEEAKVDYVFADHISHPDEWERLKSYCKQDIIAERALSEMLSHFPLPEKEIKLWHLDQKINDAGMPADREFVQKALDLAIEDKNLQSGNLIKMTGLSNANSPKQFLAWVQKQGYPYNSLRKEPVKVAMSDPEVKLTKLGRDALEVRKKSSKTSYTKLAAILPALSEDNRLRDQFLFMGSSRAGRWCLAEGSQIRVKTSGGIIDNKSIENVLITDKVWDGSEWVAHEGVVYSGDKEVITWDGVTATKEHNVFVTGDNKVTLSEARASGLSLWRGSVVYEIYKLLSPSGRFYIGLTKCGFMNRWKQHIKETKRGSRKMTHPLYRAILKYGAESFHVSVIDTAPDKIMAQALERYYIAKSPKKLLYNISEGGEADGEIGSKIAWENINKTPKSRKAYLDKLSEIKKSNDWSDYKQLSVLSAKWRQDNPRAAYKSAYRAIRLARKARLTTLSEDTRPLAERLVWKHKRSVKTRENAIKLWASRSESEIQMLSDKISHRQKLHWSSIDQADKNKIMKNARAHIDRKKQGAAASRGLKRYWAERRTSRKDL